MMIKGRKGSGTCIVPIISNSTTKRSDVDHTIACKYTTSAFPSYKHSLEGDTAANSFTHLATNILLISLIIMLVIVIIIIRKKFPCCCSASVLQCFYATCLFHESLPTPYCKDWWLCPVVCVHLISWKRAYQGLKSMIISSVIVTVPQQKFMWWAQTCGWLSFITLRSRIGIAKK